MLIHRLLLLVIIICLFPLACFINPILFAGVDSSRLFPCRKSALAAAGRTAAEGRWKPDGTPKIFWVVHSCCPPIISLPACRYRPELSRLISEMPTALTSRFSGTCLRGFELGPKSFSKQQVANLNSAFRMPTRNCNDCTDFTAGFLFHELRSVCRCHHW